MLLSLSLVLDKFKFSLGGPYFCYPPIVAVVLFMPNEIDSWLLFSRNVAFSVSCPSNYYMDELIGLSAPMLFSLIIGDFSRLLMTISLLLRLSPLAEF